MANEAEQQPAPASFNEQVNTTGTASAEVNEIATAGKWVAGILLVLATLFSLMVIIAFWPDRLPEVGDKTPRYENRLFNIRLIDTSTARLLAKKDSIRKTNKVDSPFARKDSPRVTKAIADTSHKAMMANNDTTAAASVAPCCKEKVDSRNTISINTLLLLLVAAAGFLGNMIHIATSLTTFVGSGKFKKNWLLWYCVRPFTAAGLAVVLYFSFRAGLLNSNDGAANLNLYGIITLAAFAGLFTDSATQKLKEVFDVIFKPKTADERPDKL